MVERGKGTPEEGKGEYRILNNECRMSKWECGCDVRNSSFGVRFSVDRFQQRATDNFARQPPHPRYLCAHNRVEGVIV